MLNVSRGGLSFFSEEALPLGAIIHIAIPIDDPAFEVEGSVVWCRPDGAAYTIGVVFDDQSSAYSVRMVEQVCYIEHYRASVKVNEGRELSSEQAAQEWINKYAADFPSH